MCSQELCRRRFKSDLRLKNHLRTQHQSKMKQSVSGVFLDISKMQSQYKWKLKKKFL